MNLYEDDDEGGWVQLDPQNREEWESFWLHLLFSIEEDQAMDYIENDRVQVKFNGATNRMLGYVHNAHRPDGLVSVAMDNGEIWTVGMDELLPPDAPLPKYAPFGVEEDEGP